MAMTGDGGSQPAAAPECTGLMPLYTAVPLTVANDMMESLSNNRVPDLLSHFHGKFFFARTEAVANMYTLAARAH